MIEPYEYIRSVEIIWVIWLLSVAGIVAWTIQVVRHLRGWSWRRFVRDETGAAYGLSYVMTFPFYMVLILLVLETTQLLLVKIGTVYAAYGASRAAVVWQSAQPAGQMNSKAEHAAVMAMVPFASSSRLHLTGSGSVSSDFDNYWEAYQHHSGGEGEFRGYVERKFEYAHQATSVNVAPESSAPDANITVTVNYEAPFHIPYIGRLMGGEESSQGDYLIYNLETKATLQSESPRSVQFDPNDPVRSLGIDYRSE
ncbi:Hypothetical protein PBC10988_23760 [Planctomycetales bacterium 10988]|nr:Hypothetical protein PBC10988_23760 [Planctomycetales bacterium 10988]